MSDDISMTDEQLKDLVKQVHAAWDKKAEMSPVVAERYLSLPLSVRREIKHNWGFDNDAD